MDDVSIVIGALLAISEALALVPWVRANSIFQLVVGIIRAATGRGDRQA